MYRQFSKSILVLSIAALLGAGSAMAGNGPGSCDGTGDGTCTEAGSGNGNGAGNGGAKNRGGPAERVAGMANRLGLTIQQQQRALEIFDAHAQEKNQLQARIFEDYSVEICEQRALHREEVRALLTEEQLAEHDAMMEQRQNRQGKGNGFGGFECPDS